MESGEKEHKAAVLQTANQVSEIVDYKVTMLIAAGAAMAANCEPCLNRVVPDLIVLGTVVLGAIFFFRAIRDGQVRWGFPIGIGILTATAGLIEAGVAEADIRRAVEIGQFVKDKPAAIMKEAADVLTGTHLSDPVESDGCPAGALAQPATAACGCN